MLKGLKILGALMGGLYFLVLTYLIVRSSVVSVCKASSPADKVRRSANVPLAVVHCEAPTFQQVSFIVLLTMTFVTS